MPVSLAEFVATESKPHVHAGRCTDCGVTLDADVTGYYQVKGAADMGEIESGTGAKPTLAQRAAAWWAWLKPKASHQATLMVLGLALIALPLLWHIFGAVVHYGLLVVGAALIAWGGWKALVKATDNLK